MHNELSLYFTFCIMCSVFYPRGGMTTALLLMCLAIQQYLYHLLQIPPPDGKHTTFCTECNTNTVNSYVHCTKCERCFPVSYFHWNVFDRCVNREFFHRYVAIVKLQLALNVFLSILQCIAYPPFCLIAITTTISSKSILNKLQQNI